MRHVMIVKIQDHEDSVSESGDELVDPRSPSIIASTTEENPQASCYRSWKGEEWAYNQVQTGQTAAVNILRETPGPTRHNYSASGILEQGFRLFVTPEMAHV